MPNPLRELALAIAAVFLLMGPSAMAQTPKELKTKSGASVVIVNIVNPRADCSVAPGPVALPALRERPSNGIVQMQVLVADVAASSKCPSRKIPTISLIYTPNKDFVGTDSVQIELEVGNRTTLLSYRITVQPNAQAL